MNKDIQLLDPEHNMEHLQDIHAMFQDIIRVVIRNNDGKLRVKVADLMAVSGTPGAIKIKGDDKEYIEVTEMQISAKRQ